MITGGFGGFGEDSGFNSVSGCFEPEPEGGSFERVTTSTGTAELIPSELHELKDDGRYRVNQKKN